MSRTASKTHELSEKMDAIVRRMNRGELSAEDVVRQCFRWRCKASFRPARSARRLAKVSMRLRVIFSKPGR